jgi:GNAT superfamily N-acetyltransferase
MPPAYSVRPATDADRPALLRFVLELNLFEAVFAPNRRVDDDFAVPTLDWCMARARAGNGAIFVAVDAEDAPIGWTAIQCEPYPPYIRADRVDFGYIAELYVDAGWRSQGVGRALIEAAKVHFRGLGLRHVMIGAVAGNVVARAVYEDMGFRPSATEYLMDLD